MQDNASEFYCTWNITTTAITSANPITSSTNEQTNEEHDKVQCLSFINSS